jgi:hypothetical protein
MAVVAIDLLDRRSAGGRAAPLDITAAELPTPSAHDGAVEGRCVCEATDSTLCKGVKSLKNRQPCDIDPIVGTVGTLGKN